MIVLVIVKGLLDSENKLLRPLNDNRNYKALTLNNDIKVLLIQDKELQQSAASLSVNVGSFRLFIK